MLKKLLLVVALIALAMVLAGCAQASDRGAENGSGQAAEGANQTTEDARQTVEESDQATDGDPKLDSFEHYTVAHVDGEPDWESIPQVDIDNQQWLDPVDISAHAQLCYSDDAFYVRMWAEEKDIRAEYPESDVLANTYEDSCLEFFLSPVPDDPRYLNFEFNPNCAVCAQIGAARTDRTRLVRADDPYEATSTITEDGWEIVYRVPFDFIRSFYPDFSAESGTELRGNFYKCGNLTVQKHYLSWNPIENDTPNFHMPEYFGVLVLE